MKILLFVLSLLIIVSCADKKDYTIQVSSSEEEPQDSILQISDPGVRIHVVWKSYKPKDGKVTLFDGANNPLLTVTYPSPWDALVPATERTVQYEFQPNDKPGTWRLVMVWEGEEIVNHTFEVLPAGPDPGAYQALDCYTSDGEINLTHFYQLSASDQNNLQQQLGTWYWPALIYELKKRATLCQAPELTAYQMDFWQKWFEQLSGKKVIQSNPVVHERIAALMPVYQEEFTFVNPDFIYWFSEHMVPDPEQQQINGWAFQEIYNRIGRTIARKMALTFLYYNALPNQGFDAQVQYAEMTARKYINQEEERVMERNDYVSVYTLLSEWHQEAANEWIKTQIGDVPVDGANYSIDVVDMGFWLRRGIDGSSNELWLALREVLKKYDSNWYYQYIDPHWAP